MADLSIHLVDRVVARLRRDGWACTAKDVRTVHETGTLVGNDALASAIIRELEEYGVL